MRANDVLLKADLQADPTSGAVGMGSIIARAASDQLRFDVPVSANGYRWWYLDAFTPDGSAGLTIIAFVGSVFSPYYARARRLGPADPEHFSSLNVIFYGPDRKRWALTERGRAELDRGRDYFQVGPSGITLDSDGFTVTIDERCVPFPTPLKGEVRVRFKGVNTRCFSLHSNGRHRWWPIAPACHVEVALTKPGLHWSGEGYLDSNTGTEPLEQGFQEWHWMRSTAPDGSSTIYYDTLPVTSPSSATALQRDEGAKSGPSADDSGASVGASAWRGLTVVTQGLGLGEAQDHDLSGTERSPVMTCQACDDGIDMVDPGLPAHLPVTPVWRMSRPVRASLMADREAPLKVVKTYEDTPFYTRSQLHRMGPQGPEQVMHESLDLRRFGSRWVQTLLPFRMPRRSGW